jgi:hypothetical protein
MKKLFMVILTAVMLVSLGMACGCSFRSGRFLAGNSYLGEEYPANSINTVAEHLAETLAASYPPGYTALFLKQSGGREDVLGPALESALRSRGFTLLPEPGEQTLTLVYVLDRLDEVFWYSKLTVSDGLALTRTWRAAGDDLEMEAATIRSERTEAGNVQQ